MAAGDFSFKFPHASSEITEQTVTARRSSLTINHANTLPSSPSGSFRSGMPTRKPRHTFKSYRLRGDYYQPWAEDKRLKKKGAGNYIVYGFIISALAVCGYLTYDGYVSVKDGDYCLVMEDNFNQIDAQYWTHEVQTGGFGTGSFDWTTTDAKNSFTDADGLHIVPTMTTESTQITEQQLLNGYALNLTKSGGDGSCTTTEVKQCAVKSNETLGSIIPSVRSARLSTKGKKSIRYGRVEVVAKMPKGDWLWPAIWMMPEDSVYGVWPRSGEIDIAELRGNNWKYPIGNDGVTSTIHWGPTPKTDGYWSTYGLKFLRRSDFTKGYHTYGLEWSEKYMYMYLDSRLKQIFYMKFAEKDQTLWEMGHFSGTVSNGSVLENPWKESEHRNAPFDEKFYLILNVAVGGQTGWFYDGKMDKPWVDNSPTAARDFYKAKDEWLPTWGEGNDRGMTVKSVKMWQEGKC